MQIKEEHIEFKERTAPLNPDTNPKKRSATAAHNDENGSDGNQSSPDDDKPKKRGKKAKAQPKATGFRGKSSTIPTCIEDASEADKLMLEMKDEQNKSWNETFAALEKLTGCKYNYGSLKCRYRRLKASITVIPEADQQIFLKAKHAVEMRLEKEKWNFVADEMQKRGTAKYGGPAIEKLNKKLTKSKQINTSDLTPDDSSE